MASRDGASKAPREIHQEAAGQGAEAGVEVVEARVGEAERNRAGPETRFEKGRDVLVRPEAVADPEQARAPRRGARRRRLRKTCRAAGRRSHSPRLEPGAKHRFLAAPFGAAEAADDHAIRPWEARRWR